MPDVGLEAVIPGGAWAQATQAFSHADVEHFVAGLAKVGELLAQKVPRTEHERVDLPNAPRIRE